MIHATTKGAAQLGFTQVKKCCNIEQKEVQDMKIAEAKGTGNEAGEAGVGEADCEDNSDG